jgi:transglutaminase-like putative cysteine protease
VRNWRVFAAVGAVQVLLAAPAWSSDRPAFGPPPAWVDVAPIPEPPPADGAAAVQMVLDDNQTRLGPDGDVYYNRRVLKVLKPEGLASFKSQTFTWSPDKDELTIHTLRLLRGGQAIDLLKDGQDMPVLRRETNLERASLDGRLTVSRQIEGLQTGDVIEAAYTRVHRDPVVGRSYDIEKFAVPGLVGRYRVRVSWPQATPMRWLSTAGMAPPRLSQVDGRSELDLDLAQVKAPQPPAGAPLRVRRLAEVEVSGFQTWNEVSARMAPLYARAEVLKPDSELRAEARAIAARFRTPGERAFAALALVEAKTRYFFLGMNDGGYVPAPADETWARKFGDCKGKTVLLLALLKALGVPAEPALVSTAGGDGLDERLPSAAAFNHVLVRAQIAGKTYWLDGARTGDVTGLAALQPPPWIWALPVRAGGAGLERIVQVPLDRPVVETLLRLDASAGLDRPAPARIEIRFTGDAANTFREGSARQARDDVQRTLRQNFQKTYSWIDVQTADWFDDPSSGSIRLVLTGPADMAWRLNPDLGVREFKLPGLGQGLSFPRREPGPNSDAPYAIGFPNYTRSITEVVLPDAGKGFTLRGSNDSQTIAGLEMKRSAVLDGAVARFASEVRSIVREIPAADAESANKALRLRSEDDSLVRAPA